MSKETTLNRLALNVVLGAFWRMPMTYRYKEASKRGKRTTFQRRDVKSEITVFRLVEQKGICCSFIPRYKKG